MINAYVTVNSQEKVLFLALPMQYNEMDMINGPTVTASHEM